VNNLVLSLIFGAVGLGYLTYGRQQHLIMATIAGFALMILPGLVPGAAAACVVSAVFMALPFLLRV